MTLIRTLLFAIALVAGAGALTPAAADGCYWCHPGSSCKQCRYGDTDTQDKRKSCEARGCKIGGTQACSSDTNQTMCRVEPKDPPVLACR
jgi:hypothetical protein